MTTQMRHPTPNSADGLTQIGIVIIGRNEGDRLWRCIDSVIGQVATIVYVDSGSIDGSCAAAGQRGIEVVNLDMSQAFTAARARNAGFARLRKIDPSIQYVQFIDGDCEVLPGWLAAAAAAFTTDPLVVAVCGALRERYPQRTVFNRICSVEWNWPAAGEVKAFGGNVMLRSTLFAAVGGYNNAMIAAEDDELGVRLRQVGGKLMRLDRDSMIHDADMTRLGQWWIRAKRCGYAYAAVAAIHGAAPERKFVRELERTWLWGGLMPLAVVLTIVVTKGLSLLLLCRYPIVILRTIHTAYRRGFSWGDSVVWGVSCGVSVFPELFGVMKYYRDRQRQQLPQIMEYRRVE
jgi:glycosyltransferase involved in cell wall biosynthesis